MNTKSYRAVPTEGWTSIIKPHRGWLDWRLRQLWHYRDLISLLVWRDFISVYKQTILGPAWHMIQPLLTTLTYTIIFNRVARLPTDGAPPFLFYMAGIILWNYFANCMTNTSRTFVGNSYLFSKVYFHRLVVPISVAISGLISFGIQLSIFLGFLGFYYFFEGGLRFTAWALFLPLFLLMLAGYSLGAGILISAMTTRYRDLANLVTFGVQLLMFATPVIYSSSAVPEKYRWVCKLNPLTPIIEGFRLGFLGTGNVDLSLLAVSFSIMLVVLIVGLMLFTHIESTFMDTV